MCTANVYNVIYIYCIVARFDINKKTCFLLGRPVQTLLVLNAALGFSCTSMCILPRKHQLQLSQVRGVIGQPTVYKVARLVHQSLAGQTPAYIANDIQLVTDSDRRQLRSAAARTCLVPRTHKNFGD